ncbi:hypothetical protein [Magnetospirillum gryphiswaldense]|uniref:hypothetical protein n=1 Tax=Magnetospirillum gryphiswaldense TaxID=55518 RepID=UPI001182DCA6|nr:hypothetical protein [Magnetospirillum gryphiswaldense]
MRLHLVKEQKNFRPSVSKSVRRLRLLVLTAPHRFGEAGLYQSARRAVNLFFCSTSFFPKHPAEKITSANLVSRSADRSVSAGPVFYLGAGAPSTSFFAPPKFFQRQAEKITSALLPATSTITSSLQRGRSFTSAPARRQLLFLRR